MPQSSRIAVVLVVLVSSLVSCFRYVRHRDTTGDVREISMSVPRDLHSFAGDSAARVRHVDLDLTVDFEHRRLSGTVTHSVDRNGAAELILDAKHLEIAGISAGRGGAWHAVSWRLEDGDAIRGQRLVVPLAEGDDSVAVSYSTTDQSSGLQWLLPAQTAGKRVPFLFTQSQAIHARTWIPCQDSPYVRSTYTARVQAPAGMTVVMSAARLEAGGTAVGAAKAEFHQARAIPAYLIALAVGDLEFRPLGKRCGVWAEPSVVARAADEFSDTEKMVTTVEGLYGPYLWGRYDILVLPPSFPFGGMENPCMTFATPTVLAGDKSGVALIAHELAHSWSGNLVTNATWRDFWLNEGFTVYLEQRIMEAVYGRERYEMEVVLGMKGLEEEMAALEPRDQILHVDLAGRDPDDGFTGVPYEKGAAFLRLLEIRFGRDVFDAFLRSWFEANRFTSVTTEYFVDFLRRGLFAKYPEIAAGIDVDLWIRKPGMPAEAPSAQSAALQRVDDVANRWLDGSLAADAIDVRGWSAHEWLRFISTLGKSLDVERLAVLDRAFALTTREHAEITSAWLELCIRSGYAAAWPRVEAFLLSQGRRKFLKPLYTALAGAPGTKDLGLAIYVKARPGYHPIATATIDPIIGFTP